MMSAASSAVKSGADEVVGFNALEHSRETKPALNEAQREILGDAERRVTSFALRVALGIRTKRP